MGLRVTLRTAAGLILLVLVRTSAIAQQSQTFPRISYRLAMSRPASHLFEVTIEAETPPRSNLDHVDLQIPRWQPGRYAIADFAVNVQEFRAMSGGKALPFMKTDDQTWRVQTLGSKGLTITYKVFGNDLSGTFAQLNTAHANYNGGEIFMYIVGHKPDPVELHINPPGGWSVINGRSDQPNQLDWKFPNYEILIDNPTEIGPDWTLDEFQVDGKKYRVVVHSQGSEGGRRSAFVADVEKIVRAETRMWGIPDLESFTFIFHFAGDDRSGDGMEHLTSSQIINPGVLSDPYSYRTALDSAAHEFFHVWNVKRLRPAELGPWDWTKPVSTRSLWIAEGLTQYYGDIMMDRAGLHADAATLGTLAGAIAAIDNSPGSRLMSAEESSLAAPFIDGELHRQRTNLSNNTIDYYRKGELIGMVLDLLIRGRSRGQHSLDDVMRKMYQDFYVKSPRENYYLKGRGYKGEDFARAVSSVAGMDMSDFFARYVQSASPLPYDEALAHVGLKLVKTPAPRTAGIVIDETDRRNLRLDVPRSDSAAERGGLQQGDILISIGTRSVTTDTWEAALNTFKEGDRVPINVRRNRGTVELSVVLGPPEIFYYRIEEVPNATAQAKALRVAWLKGN